MIGLDHHGSAEQHYTQVCCNLRQPLQRLHPDEQPKYVLNIVKLMSMHASKVSESERAAMVAALVDLIGPKRTSQQVNKWHETSFQELVKLTIQALGYIMACGSPALPTTSLQQIAPCLSSILVERSVNTCVPTDRVTSHFLYSVLRLLHTVISQVKNEHGISLGPLVDSLRQLCGYGISLMQRPIPFTAHSPSPVSQAPPSSLDSAPRSPAYRPPHARRRSSQNVPPCTMPTPGTNTLGAAAGSWRSEDGGYSSASDASDCESGAVADASRTCRVRLAALSCLQALAKADCKALHPHWVVLLPVHDPLARRPDSLTLMDALVNDPIPKVRARTAATMAALLEGAPQRAYLGIAECRLPSKQPVRGFTTLSATLGKLAVSLHDGLLQAAASDADQAALASVLRTLHVLISSAPYLRLPSTLLARVLTDMHRCCMRLQSGVARATEEATAAAEAAALSCIAAALTSDAARTDLAELLSVKATAADNPAQSHGMEFGARLASDLLKLSRGPPLAVAAEALAALQALAVSHRGLLACHWGALKSVMLNSLAAEAQAVHAPGTGGEERCALNSLRLLGSYLKVHADDAPPGADSAMCAQEWRDACASIVPKGVAHPLPSVRAAAFAGLSSLDQAACAALGDEELHRVWGWLRRSASGDPAAAVRAAALKTAGCLAQLPHSLQHPGAAVMLAMIEAGLRDSALSVQIAAAWALANLADALTQATPHEPAQCTSIAEAALAAANSGDKVRTNAVRAIGYLVAAGSSTSLAADSCRALPAPHKQCRCSISGSVETSGSPGELTCAADMPALSHESSPEAQSSCASSTPQTSTANAHSKSEMVTLPDRHVQTTSSQHCDHAYLSSEGDGTGIQGPGPPDWFVRGLACLANALASGNGKVQWNACYAIGALLRCPGSAGAAAAAGGLQPLLAHLLHVLQHSANFKTRMHAAAALCAVRDGQLFANLQPDVVTALRSALEGLDGNNSQDADKLGAVENLQNLYPLKEQLHATLKHVEGLVACTAQEREVDRTKPGDSIIMGRETRQD
ncbi:probable HEAT repeat-containing protein 6 at N-terminal half [Coccomyxa sp. Obi]|nr:probable HEAT repeat-containing protein 6 at N-terminal half [Coccomyxa sp. Obi]